jgi:dipeptidyl aminopeptidase/acylaminoacyl peptidase
VTRPPAGAVATDTGDDPADPTTREAQLLGAAPATVPELAAQASPVTHVSPAAPPFLLLHGESDRFVPHVQSVRLHTALVEAGGRADLYLYEGADHMWLGTPHAAEQALDRTIETLRRLLHDETTEEEQP